MSEQAHVGIDLGTTYSLVSIMQAGTPRIVPNSLGELLTPSAVSVLEDGRIVTGSLARARAVTHPERTAVAFKRDMGTDRRFRLADREFTPEQLSALVLREMKAEAEASLGMPIAEAVVTVPAYFGEHQRRATKAACELAELRVERIINEPTAAALAFGLHQRERELRAVVLDLGGGTFDVTVLELIEGVLEIQATAGDSRLGGEDFVDAIVEIIRDDVMREHGFDPTAERRNASRVREACESAKRRLSVQDFVRVCLVNLEPSGSFEVELGRARVEQAWEPLLQRMRTPIQRALRDARCDPTKIDEVLLVGGATRMPCVPRMAAVLFGRRPLDELPADEAVALGAAIQVALKVGDAAVDDFVVTDVAPFTLGMAVGNRVGPHTVTGMFSPILDRGTVLPASRSKVYATLGDNQTVLRVEIYQGENSMCRDNQKLGELEVKHIPRGPAGAEAVEVRFTYDLNGILDVDATVLSTKKTSSIVLEQVPGRFAPKQLEEIRKQLATLKFHPREALPNVTALARADALHAILVGGPRDEVNDAISRFRLALETQDVALIANERELLLELVGFHQTRSS